MNQTTTPALSPGDIVLIVTSVMTLLISLANVIIDYIAHTKDRKIKLACSDCCAFVYESSEEEKPSGRAGP